MDKTSYNVDKESPVLTVKANTTMDAESQITTLNALPVLVGDPAIQWGDTWKRVARDWLEIAGLTFTTLNVCRVEGQFGRNDPVCLFITVEDPESADFIAVQDAIENACLQAVETWPLEEIQVVIKHEKGIRYASDQGNIAGERDTFMAMGQTITTETASMDHLSTTLTCAISIRPHQGEPYTAWLSVHHGTSTSNEPVSAGVQVLCPSNSKRKEMEDDLPLVLNDYEKAVKAMEVSLEREGWRLGDEDPNRQPENVKQRIQSLKRKLEAYRQTISDATQKLEWSKRESSFWRCGSIEKTSGLDQKTAIGGSMDWAVIRPFGESLVGATNQVQLEAGPLSIEEVKSVKDLMQSNMESEVYRYGGVDGLNSLAPTTFNCIKSEVRLPNGRGGHASTKEYAFIGAHNVHPRSGDSGSPIVSKKEKAIYGQVIAGSQQPPFFTYVTDIGEILPSIQKDLNVRSVTLAT